MPAPSSTDALLEALAALAASPLAEARALPPGLYTDPGVHALEMEHVLARGWTCVGRDEQVARPGDYLTAALPGAELMVVRQADGALRALSRVCRHRGALLGEAGGGSARLFVCPYHKWTYELDGALRGAPGMSDAPAFRAADCALPSFPVEVWQGFVFVNGDPGAAPLGPQLAPLDPGLEAHRLAGLGVAFTLEEVWDANWKVAFENGCESYHHMGVHGATLEPYFPALGTRCEPGGEAYNLHVVPGAEGFAFEAREGAGALSPEAATSLVVVGIYPTSILVLSGETATLFTFTPLDVERTLVRASWLVPAATLADPGAAGRLARDRATLEAILAEDRRSCGQVQRGLRTRDATGGPLAPLERTVAEFARHLAARLGGALRP